VNALSNNQVAEYVNDRFVSVYQKAGTFRVVNGEKQGGNVASYFCRPNGTVLHAVAGLVKADVLLAEARWAVELHKSALAEASNLANGNVDEPKYRSAVKQAHADRYQMEMSPGSAQESLRGMKRSPTPPDWAYRKRPTPSIAMLPRTTPHTATDRAKVHWVLHKYNVPDETLPQLSMVSRIVWEDVLGERFSYLPVLEK
jgi:hypothetical protein